ncbi:WW domain-containing protein [Entamoeba marina]
MSNVIITPHIINPGYGIGERLQGYIILSTNKRIIVTHLHFTITGNFTLSENSSDKRAHKSTHLFYTSRNYSPLAEQTQPSTEPYYHEYFPGHHTIPFSIIIPVVPHPTTILQNGVGIHYSFNTTVQVLPPEIKGDVTASLNTFTYINSIPITILFCVNDPSTNKTVEEVLSSDNILIRLNCLENLPLGADIKPLVIISNNSKKPIKPILRWYSEHVYKSTYITSNGGIMELPEILPSKFIQKEFVLDSSKLFSSISVGDFSINTYVEVRVSIPKKPTLENRIPVVIGWAKGKVDAMLNHAKQHGVEMTKEKMSFYGAHFRPAPSTINKVEVYDDAGKSVYVSHVERKCYSDEALTQPVKLRYPLQSATNLPMGWGLQSDRGELYFVNYEKNLSTWIDPRTFQERKIPLWTCVVTVVEGRNFITPKGKIKEYTAIAYNKDFEKIKTGKSTKSIDPVWNGNNELIISNDETRENLVIGFYAGNSFIGGVDIALWRIAKNGISEWFQLRNFGDFSIGQTAEVLLKIIWKGEELPEEPDPFTHAFDRCILNTDSNREIIKCLNKARSKMKKSQIEFKLTGEPVNVKKMQCFRKWLFCGYCRMGISVNYDVDLIGSKNWWESNNEVIKPSKDDSPIPKDDTNDTVAINKVVSDKVDNDENNVIEEVIGDIETSKDKDSSELIKELGIMDKEEKDEALEDILQQRMSNDQSSNESDSEMDDLLNILAEAKQDENNSKSPSNEQINDDKQIENSNDIGENDQKNKNIHEDVQQEQSQPADDGAVGVNLTNSEKEILGLI